jgi:hypothetical protein
MTGGILRQAGLIRSLQVQSPTVVIDTGDLTASDSKQEVMKAQTLAETLKSVNVDAVNLTPGDLKLGLGNLENIQELLGGKLTSGNLQHPESLEIDPLKLCSGFIVLGLSSSLGQISREIDKAVTQAEARANRDKLRLVVMLEGNQQAATALAKFHPSIDLITYRSSSAPADHPTKIGKTILASPGEHGEYLITVGFPTSGDPIWTPYKLTPEIPDDPTAERFYNQYLHRLDGSGLWERFSRTVGKPFAGSETCGKCHIKEYNVWKTAKSSSNGEPSSHSFALTTLEKRGHGKDPECVPCHVTSASTTTGYHSRASDPQLAFVGCESCHGAGADHSQNPWKHALVRLSQTEWSESCKNCHRPLNSPNFDFAVYWGRIEHGNGDKRWKSKK